MPGKFPFFKMNVMRLFKILCLAIVLLSAGLEQVLAAAPGGGVGSIALRTLDSISGLSTDRLVADGDSLFARGDYDSALSFFTVVCRRYGDGADDSMLPVFAKAFNRYGNILYKRGAYSLAMDSYLQMRRIAEEHGMGEELATAYVRIGNIYAASGDYESAADFYTRALAVPEITGNRECVYQMAVNNLFASSILSGNISAARRYLDMYEKSRGEAAKTPRHLFDISLGEGLIALEKGDRKTALANYREALECALENNLDPLCVGSAYSCLGEVYKRLGNRDSAVYYLRNAKEIARTAGNGRLMVESLRDLADFFEESGLPDSANAYRAVYLNLADSISYQEEVNKFKSSQMLYELDKSEYTIRSLNDQKRVQSTVIWVIAVAVVICATLAVVLYVQNRKLRAAWIDLYERSRRQLGGEPAGAASAGGYGKDELAGGEEDGEGEEREGRKMVTDAVMQKEIADAILAYMDHGEEYCSADFSLERLASEIGYNARYVSEVINVAFKKNFRTLLNEYRVRKAMLRLQDTENYGRYTIKAISESVGYKSPATFNSVFTKATGLKPGIYQKLAREQNLRQ